MQCDTTHPVSFPDHTLQFGRFPATKKTKSKFCGHIYSTGPTILCAGSTARCRGSRAGGPAFWLGWNGGFEGCSRCLMLYFEFVIFSMFESLWSSSHQWLVQLFYPWATSSSNPYFALHASSDSQPTKTKPYSAASHMSLSLSVKCAFPSLAWCPDSLTNGCQSTMTNVLLAWWSGRWYRWWGLSRKDPNGTNASYSLISWQGRLALLNRDHFFEIADLHYQLLLLV